MSALKNVYEVRRRIIGTSGSAYTESVHPDSREQVDRLARIHVDASDGVTLASGFEELLTPPVTYQGFDSFDVNEDTIQEVDGETALTLEPGTYVTHEFAGGFSLAGGGDFLATPYGQILIWPDGAVVPEDALFLEAGWVVALPVGVTVLSIMLPDGDLWLRGFRFDSVPGLIWFRDDPKLLFPGRKMMATSERVSRFKGAYSLGIDSTPYMPEYMIAYARATNDLNTLYRATAEAMDLGIAYADGYIRRTDICEQGTIYYTTADEEICAKYPHTPKSLDEFIAKGEVVGGDEVLKFVSSENWQTLDWTAGLSLDGLAAVDGLRVFDEDITLSFDGSGNPTFVGITEDTPGAEANRLAIAAPFDTAQGNPVMSYYGESPGGSVTVNALEFFMSLCPSLIVNYSPVFFYGDRLTRLKKFLTKEVPLGLHIIYREI